MTKDTEIRRKFRAGLRFFFHVGNQSDHLIRVENQLKKYQLAYKCRMRWRRRHMKGLIHLAQIKYDPIGESLLQKTKKYHRLLEYLKFKKWRKETDDRNQDLSTPR